VTENKSNWLKLPQGWKFLKLEDLTLEPKNDIVDGPFGSNLKASEYLDDGIPIIRLQNIDRNFFKENNLRFINPQKADFLKRHSFSKGDIVITKLGEPLGKACLVPDLLEEGIIVADIVRLRTEEQYVSKKYLVYLINSCIVINQLQEQTKGTTRPRVNLDHIRKLQIPCAPLNEQRRIVAKIEALKARSQRVKEELEAIPALLDQFRQSVLAAAFRGDLTADWREKNPDIEPASVLLERIRVERRRRWEEAELEKMKAQGKTPKDDKWKEKYKEPESVDDSHLLELPDKWCWATLDQLLFSLRNGLSKRPEDQPPGIPILRISAVRSMEVNTSDIRFYPIDAAEDISSYLLESGDLLFTRYNGSRSFVGVCGLLPNLTDDLLYPDKLIRGQVVDKLLCLSKYLELACNFGVSRSHIDSHIKTSAGQQGIAGSDLKSTPIPLPPVAEQYKIVQAVNQQFSATQSLAAMADESAKNVQLLDQSILAKAFRGELVPQDPNDEPASVLLERIRTEREKLDTKKKAKGKTEKKSRKAKPEPAEPEQLSLPGFE